MKSRDDKTSQNRKSHDRFVIRDKTVLLMTSSGHIMKSPDKSGQVQVGQERGVNMR